MPPILFVQLPVEVLLQEDKESYLATSSPGQYLSHLQPPLISPTGPTTAVTVLQFVTRTTMTTTTTSMTSQTPPQDLGPRGCLTSPSRRRLRPSQPAAPSSSLAARTRESPPEGRLVLSSFMLIMLFFSFSHFLPKGSGLLP